MTLQRGTRLGSYEILDPLGAGAMGEVYRATDTKLRREVAIKVLPDEVARDQERLARFQREALLLAALNHPNIATIHGIEESDGRPCLVLELVEGETLGERIAAGALPLDEVLELGRQIAAGLEAAHEKGIIHRDLKPDNIKVTADGTVKVLDFGLAKAFDVAPGESAGGTRSPTVTSGGTLAGVILGTAAYMSPEQARGKPLDKRSDIWSLGCVLFECLAARRPFEGETITDVLSRILQREPDWSALPESTPPRLRDLLQRCLEKDARNRLRDAGDARLELARVVDGGEWPAGGGAATAPPAARLPWASRRAGLLLAAGLVAGAALGYGLVGMRPSAPSSTTRLSIVTSADVLGSPVVSPDGRTIAYMAMPTEGGGEPAVRLFLRRLEGYGEIALRGSERVDAFVFSPDGGSVAFVARDAGDSARRRLFRAPVDGSALPVALADVPAAVASLGVWLRDGSILAVQTAPWSVRRFPSEGGEPGPAVEVKANGVGQNILAVTSALPDGRHVLFAGDSYEPQGWQMNVALLDLDTGEGRALLPGDSPHWSASGHLVFTRGDQMLAIGFDPQRLATRGAAVTIADGVRVDPHWLNARLSLGGGTVAYLAGGRVADSRGLTVVDRSGHQVPWSEEPRFYFGAPVVSPDGRWLAVEMANPSAGLIEVWISEVDRPRLRPFVGEANMDCSTGIWSARADWLAYDCRGVEGRTGLYIRDRDAAGAPRFLVEKPTGGTFTTPTAIAADGSALLVTQWEGERIDILRVPLHEAKDVVPIASLAKPEVSGGGHGRISPDGRVLAYTAFTSGRAEIALRPVGEDGSVGRQGAVSLGPGALPVWGKTARDGEFLLTWRDPGAFSLTGTATLRVIYEATIRTHPTLDASAPRVLFDADEVARLGVLGWDTLPDGRLLVVRKAPQETEARQIQVVLDAAADLARQVPPS